MSYHATEIESAIRDSREKPLPTKERQEILDEIKGLTQELLELEKYRSNSFYSWITPAGAEGRSWDEELSYALKRRNDGYIPKLSYPALESEVLDPKDPENSKLDIDGGINAIEKLQTEIPKRFIKTQGLAQNIIEKKKKEFLFLKAVKNHDHESQIRYMPFEVPDQALITFAEACHESKLVKKTESDLFKKLKGNILNSTEIKEYFDYAFKILGAEDWTVGIVDDMETIEVLPENKSVIVPTNKTLSAFKLLDRIAHEIGIHALTAINAEKNGFDTTPLGEDYEVLQEGLAKSVERDLEEMLFGKPGKPEPYYVLAINESIKTNGNFWKVYDYVKNLRLAELIAQKIEKEDQFDKKSSETASRVTRRIFRGSTDLDSGGYTFTKDKVYLEGEKIVAEIKEKGLIGCLLSGKYDIPTAVYLLRNGVIPSDAVNVAVDVAQKIWMNEGDRDFLINLITYKENSPEPYWRNYGLTDEEYLKRWKNLS